jgi:hypothetical protein
MALTHVVGLALLVDMEKRQLSVSSSIQTLKPE